MTAEGRFGQDQPWRVLISASSPSGSLAAIYDHELPSMGLLLGIRIYTRPTFYEIRFAVSAPDIGSAMTAAAECWDTVISSLPLPPWEPHRVTVERVTPPMARVLSVVASTDRPGPGLVSAEVEAFPFLDGP